jgi:hypothetical protein
VLDKQIFIKIQHSDSHIINTVQYIIGAHANNTHNMMLTEWYELPYMHSKEESNEMKLQLP